ncbi:ATP-grasp domain-containing protein [Gelidibacter sp. F2691]|nr:ATP-grasp domain-containing protein [Gelidibacter sp. F2691]
MNILITSAGRRVSLVRSFQKEIRLAGLDTHVYAVDSNPILSAACQVADAFFSVPKLNDPTYIEALLVLSITHKVRVIIPTIDTELLLLAKHKAHFESRGVSIVISSSEFVSKCRNKRLIHEFFTAQKIKVAQEFSKDNYSLPLYIKPIDGSRSVDNYIIRTKEELTDYHLSNPKLMFLEYLDHEHYDEYTCDLYYDREHNLKCVVPRKRIEVRDGEVYKALTVKNYLSSYIKHNLNHIFGAVGCLTAQFFVSKTDETQLYGIEINPRFGGGYPLSYLAGANFSKWIIEEYMLGKTINDNFDVWENELLMIRYDDEILVHGYKG